MKYMNSVFKVLILILISAAISFQVFAQSRAEAIDMFKNLEMHYRVMDRDGRVRVEWTHLDDSEVEQFAPDFINSGFTPSSIKDGLEFIRKTMHYDTLESPAIERTFLDMVFAMTYAIRLQRELDGGRKTRVDYTKFTNLIETFAKIPEAIGNFSTSYLLDAFTALYLKWGWAIPSGLFPYDLNGHEGMGMLFVAARIARLIKLDPRLNADDLLQEYWMEFRNGPRYNWQSRVNPKVRVSGILRPYDLEKTADMILQILEKRHGFPIKKKCTDQLLNQFSDNRGLVF
jgi:hypothetical protein